MVEADGGVRWQQGAYDAERDALLQPRGLSVLRISNDEILESLGGVLARIANSCRRAGET